MKNRISENSSHKMIRDTDPDSPSRYHT